MSNDIRRAFDEMLEPPHPALRAMVRARLDASSQRKEVGLMLRLVQVGAAMAALFVVGALTLTYLTVITNNHGRPGSHGTGASPGPSPSVTSSPDGGNLPSCSATYTLNGKVVTATVTTDGAPLKVTVVAYDARGYLGSYGSPTTAKYLVTGDTTIQMSVVVIPPVTSVDVVLDKGRLERICQATFAG
jgi:hypothetical protein